MFDITYNTKQYFAIIIQKLESYVYIYIYMIYPKDSSRSHATLPPGPTGGPEGPNGAGSS